MKKLFIVVILVLSGCASLSVSGCMSGEVVVDCLHVYSLGTDVVVCSEIELEDYAPRLMNDAIELVEREAQYFYPKVTNLRQELKKSNAVVNILEESFLGYECKPFYKNIMRCNSSLAGYNYNGSTIIINWKSCGSVATFAHELIHSVEQFYLGGMSDHKAPHLFDDEFSVEKRAVRQVYGWCWGPGGVATPTP